MEFSTPKWFRFSRGLHADLLKQDNPIPDSASQEKKISSAVRHRLPAWIEATVRSVIAAALQKAGLEARLTLAGKDRDKLILAYPAVKMGTGYSPSTILLEFGVRPTGELHLLQPVIFEIAPEIEGATFPATALTSQWEIARRLNDPDFRGSGTAEDPCEN